MAIDLWFCSPDEIMCAGEWAAVSSRRVASSRATERARNRPGGSGWAMQNRAEQAI